MPDNLSQQAALVAAYVQASHRRREALKAYVTRLWKALGDYRNPARFVSEVVPAVLGAQQQMAGMTAAYLARYRALTLGGTGVPLAIDPALVTGSASRNGTSLTDVYERPFHTVWRELADLPHEAGAIDDAINAGMQQAVSEALTDLQRSKTLTSQHVVSRDRQAVGYRRVLEGTYSCALCVVASTQRYHVADLSPIHPACDCGVAPIYGDADPGRIINTDALRDIHDRIAERFGADASSARIIDGQVVVTNKRGDTRRLLYRDVLIEHQHDELGPILGVRQGLDLAS